MNNFITKYKLYLLAGLICFFCLLLDLYIKIFKDVESLNDFIKILLYIYAHIEFFFNQTYTEFFAILGAIITAVFQHQRKKQSISRYGYGMDAFYKKYSTKNGMACIVVFMILIVIFKFYFTILILLIILISYLLITIIAIDYEKDVIACIRDDYIENFKKGNQRNEFTLKQILLYDISSFDKALNSIKLNIEILRKCYNEVNEFNLPRFLKELSESLDSFFYMKKYYNKYLISDYVQLIFIDLLTLTYSNKNSANSESSQKVQNCFMKYYMSSILTCFILTIVKNKKINKDSKLKYLYFFRNELLTIDKENLIFSIIEIYLISFWQLTNFDNKYSDLEICNFLFEDIENINISEALKIKKECKCLLENVYSYSSKDIKDFNDKFYFMLPYVGTNIVYGRLKFNQEVCQYET